MHSFARTGLITIALASTAASATAQGSFVSIGPGRAEGVSADGQWVGGTDTFAGNGWRWTAGSGVTSIGGTRGLAITSDGQTMFGEDGSSPTTAAVWRASSGWQSLGGVAPGGCPDLSNPYDFSNDGRVATGLAWNGCAASGFKWTPGSGMAVLSQFGSASRGNVVSGDGQWIGGWDQGPNRQASLWDSAGVEQLLLVDPVLNPSGLGEVWALTTDGSVAAGSGSNTLGAFYWTQGGGPVYIGNRPGQTGTTAMAISDDGGTIIGFDGGGPFSTPGAFIWTTAGGLQELGAYATAAGITLPPGIALSGAFDMTPDGRTIVGAYTSGGFTETAFILTLPDPCGAVTYGQGASPANYMAMSASGSTSIGGTLTLNTFSAPAVGIVTGVSLASASLPLLGGVLLVDPAQLFLLLNSPVVGSTAVTNIPIPPDPALVGVDFFFQSAGPDPALPGGWAFSNGVQLTTCP